MKKLFVSYLYYVLTWSIFIYGAFNLFPLDPFPHPFLDLLNSPCSWITPLVPNIFLQNEVVVPR